MGLISRLGGNFTIQRHTYSRGDVFVNVMQGDFVGTDNHMMIFGGM